MKHWHQKLFLLLLLASSCKRTELELTDTNNITLPGTGDITSARSIEEERSANLKRQTELDAAIVMLKDSLANSKNLSSEQREQLNEKIAAAEAEKNGLSRREKELSDKLAETQKALDEARTRNEELKKELAKAKEREAERKKDEPITGETKTQTKVAPLGPFVMFKGDQCLEVQNKSNADNALLGMGTCKSEAHQSFLFDKADESGAYRIMPQSSQKCFAVEKGSLDLGAKLIQTTCSLTDKAQQFYVLGLNDTDFLLQSVKSQYCFSLQADKSLTQVVCDTKLETTFRINNPTK
ncbi:MAG: RICIN domain-containing protein [Oligoflexus sp.]|nr:RICIN domain-containing protein [Oligoflexus sp.]